MRKQTILLRWRSLGEGAGPTRVVGPLGRLRPVRALSSGRPFVQRHVSGADRPRGIAGVGQVRLCKLAEPVTERFDLAGDPVGGFARLVFVAVDGAENFYRFSVEVLGPVVLVHVGFVLLVQGVHAGHVGVEQHLAERRFSAATQHPHVSAKVLQHAVVGRWLIVGDDGEVPVRASAVGQRGVKHDVDVFGVDQVRAHAAAPHE